jgi:thymidylate synthase
VKAYLQALEEIYTYGNIVETEHGVRTKSLQGVMVRHDVRKGWPLLTTKEINWKHQVAEVAWYLSGESGIQNLRKYARYWDTWADDAGNLQSAYGRFWRAFPSPDYHDVDAHVDREKATVNFSGYPNSEIWAFYYHPYCQCDYHGSPVRLRDTGVNVFDQVASVLHMIQKDPHTRRALVSAWHPANAHVSKLPPCHFAWRLSYDGKTLNMTVYQRSADFPIGVPYNIAQYSLLLRLCARTVDLPAGQIVFFFDDAHIYENQLPIVRKQLMREPKPLPQIIIPEDVHALAFDWKDIDRFALINYDAHPAISYPVTAVGVNTEKTNE